MAATVVRAHFYEPAVSSKLEEPRSGFAEAGLMCRSCQQYFVNKNATLPKLVSCSGKAQHPKPLKDQAQLNRGYS